MYLSLFHLPLPLALPLPRYIYYMYMYLCINVSGAVTRLMRLMKKYPLGAVVFAVAFACSAKCAWCILWLLWVLLLLLLVHNCIKHSHTHTHTDTRTLVHRCASTRTQPRQLEGRGRPGGRRMRGARVARGIVGLEVGLANF